MRMEYFGVNGFVVRHLRGCGNTLLKYLSGESMKKGKRVLTIFLAGLMLAGCGIGKGGSLEGIYLPQDEKVVEGGNLLQDNKETGSGGAPDDGMESSFFLPERYVEWLVPDIIFVSEETLSKFNELLADRGCNFGLKLTTVDFNAYSDLVVSGTYSPDIAFVGFDRSAEAEDVGKLIASGYFECLDDMLTGSALNSVISDKLWDGVRYGGKIYTIPTGAASDPQVSVIFNLEKVSQQMAEDFSGELAELPKVLGENGLLLYSGTAFSFMEYYGYSYENGILISQEGKVETIFENETFLQWLKFLNKLYLQGRVITDVESQDWSIALVGVSRPVEKNTSCYSAKAIINTRYSASTGIVKTSEHKEDAFRLLELLHTDSELANCLLYGTEYVEKDGYAVDQEGKLMSVGMQKMVFGVNENVLWDEFSVSGNRRKFQSSKDKLEYYENFAVESPIIGMRFETDTMAIRGILAQYEHQLWMSEDLEGLLTELEEELAEAGIYDLKGEIRAALDGR